MNFNTAHEHNVGKERGKEPWPNVHGAELFACINSKGRIYSYAEEQQQQQQQQEKETTEFLCKEDNSHTRSDEMCCKNGAFPLIGPSLFTSELDNLEALKSVSFECFESTPQLPTQAQREVERFLGVVAIAMELAGSLPYEKL